jgi:CheY-like chemotaxis protein
LLTNLIINAVDACEQSGTIIIRARPDGEQILLEVADSGHGMTEEVRARCLEPFFTTKKDRGTGLGLPMVHSIVRRHGGSIVIESAPGEGTVIGVRLPRPAEGDERSEAVPDGLSRGPWRVLVVDDEERVRTVLRGYLQHAGHQVTTVSTADQALDALATAEVDVLLLDRAMPDMSGDQLAILVRQVAPLTRILMLSGFGAAPCADGSMPDVDGILAKPVRLEELMTAIAQVMGVKTSERGTSSSDICF